MSCKSRVIFSKGDRPEVVFILSEQHVATQLTTCLACLPVSRRFGSYAGNCSEVSSDTTTPIGDLDFSTSNRP